MILRPGQTLLEVVIAIGIIISSVSASTTLIISTIGAGRVAQSNIEATNLAREGIEAVQAIRDSNWLKRDQNIGDDPNGAVAPLPVNWDDSGFIFGAQNVGYAPMGSESLSTASPGGGECNPAVASVTEYFRASYGATGWVLNEEVQGNVCNNIRANPNNYTVYRINTAGTEKYTQTPAGASATKYRRIISVTKRPETVGTNTIDYLDVTSEVIWFERGGGDTTFPGYNHRVVAQKRFYNWRQ